MSASKKPSTFLTEKSNLEDQEKNEELVAVAKAKSSSAHLQVTVDGESLNDDGDAADDEDENNQSEEEDDDDDDYLDDVDEYVNPFSQFLPLQQPEPASGNNQSSGEEIGIKNDEPEDENRPLSARAPKIYEQDDAHVEISSTPAFQCLEELFQNGKLTGTQVAQLKAKYVELHLTLKRSRENEARLLKESKECLKQLDDNKEVLQKADAFPDNLTNEVLKIRAQYLKYENDAACADERLYNLEYKLAG
jgi:hypothetical protein